MGQESISKTKSNDDDHASHHEKSIERRRSTDRDSDDGSGERGKPASANQQTEVSSVNSSAITNSTSSSSFSSSGSSCTDEHEKREATSVQQNAADSNVHTSSTDSDDNFLPASAPVVVDQMLIGNEINLEMLMETNDLLTGGTDPVMTMLQKSVSDDSEMQRKKPKVADNIHEARKLMKVRKQMEREKKKRLEKLLVQTKQMVGSNANEEQGVELEFSVMNSSAPFISSPIKQKDGLLSPAPVNEKRNSGEFIIDMKEMEKQMKKKKHEKHERPEKTVAKYAHKFDEILSQIDKPRKRDSKGSTSPISPIHDRSPKYERKYVREQSKECTVTENKKPTSPIRHQSDDKKIERSVRRSQDGSKSRRDSSSSKSPEKPAKSHTSSKHERIATKQSTSKQSTVGLADSQKDSMPTTSQKHENKRKVRTETLVNSNVDLDEENSEDFYGFLAEELLYETIPDYDQVKEILEARSRTETLHLMNCSKSMCQMFSDHSCNVFDVAANDERLISEKYPDFDESVQKSVAGSNTKKSSRSLSSKNGVRTTSNQQKLFIENNQFADSSEAKQTSRKRPASGSVQGTAAKVVRLVDSKTSGDEAEDDAEETSPTPSEQSKENKIIRQIKKNNRTTDNTSNGKFIFP